MKLKFRYLVLIGFILPFVLFSCKTTDTGTRGNIVGPADDASLESIAQARAAAEEARSRAEYVNGDDYFPDEWGLAEDRYSKAKDYAEPETKAETVAQLAEWKALTVVYEGIFNKSAPLFAVEQQKMLAAARAEAVDAGAEELVPDRLAQADAYAGTSREKLEKADFPGSVKDGKEALDRYNVLLAIAKAHNQQVEADNNQFFSTDPDNYMLAAEAGNKAVDLYDEAKFPEAQEAADEALNRFNQVVKNGWVSKVEEKASVANEWRTASQEVKANVAVRPEYDAAERIYNNAHVALRADEYAVASELFEQSSGLFAKAHDNAVIKRDRADEALREAEQKLAASEEKAQTAVELIGGE